MMGNGYGMMAFGGLGMLVFWALVIVGVIYLVRWLSENQRPAQRGGSVDGAMQIARERLARGEIGVEEYESIKRTLER